MSLPAILLISLLVSTKQDEFLFTEPDSEIVLKFHDTAAFSRVGGIYQLLLYDCCNDELSYSLMPRFSQ